MAEQRIAYSLNFSDVIRILRLVDETDFQELELELDELKLHLVNDHAVSLPRPTASVNAAPTEAASVAPTVTPPSVAAPQALAARSANHAVAPLAGTFYRAPAPGAPPFVEVGSAVKAGDVVGILEIMKLMNYVTAPCAGIIAKICAGNEEFVEYGQLLAIIDPEPVE